MQVLNSDSKQKNLDIFFTIKSDCMRKQVYFLQKGLIREILTALSFTSDGLGPIGNTGD